VVVAVNWSKLPAAVGIPDWNGRIVIDANTPIGLFKPIDLQGRVSTEVFAALVPGARVGKGSITCVRKCWPAIRGRIRIAV
jgi:hypothetical protein